MKKQLIPQYISFVRRTFEDFSIGNIPQRIMDLIEINEPDCTVMKFLIQPTKGKRDKQYYLVVYSFLQFKIQMLHTFIEQIIIMNQYPFFIKHRGIGVINEMISLAVDTEESKQILHYSKNLNSIFLLKFKAIRLRSVLDDQIINENQLSEVILDYLKGWKILLENKITYHSPFSASFLIEVETYKGKLDHINPRNYSPNIKFQNQSKQFITDLYSILLKTEIKDNQAQQQIGTKMPLQFLCLYHLLQEQNPHDFVLYYEREMLLNDEILNFYQTCLNSDQPKIQFEFNGVDYSFTQYQQEALFYTASSPKELDSAIILENSPFDLSFLDNKTQQQISQILINSKYTNQEVFIKYYKYLKEGELLKAYNIIKSFEEENEVDSITYLALSNTLCKIVENKTLNEYLKTLKEEDLIRQIEKENSSDKLEDDNQHECLTQLARRRSSYRKKSYDCSSYSSSEDSNTSLQSIVVCSQDLLIQLQKMPTQKKLILKQYSQKIKQTYQQSISKNPFSVISYFNLSLEYCSTTEIDIIIKLLKKCLVIQKYDYEVLYQLSVLYWNKQKYDQARKYFKKQIFIKNFELSVCLNIYKSYQRQNKISNAIYYFKTLEKRYQQFKNVSQQLWLQIETDILSVDQNQTIMLT